MEKVPTVLKKSFKDGHLGGGVLQVYDARLNHFIVQIVALAGALSDSGEHRVATVSLGHVVDQLHDQDSLTHAGAAKQTWHTTGRNG